MLGIIWMLLFFIVLAISLGGVVHWLWRKQIKRVETQLQVLSNELKLEYSPTPKNRLGIHNGYPELTGKIGEQEVRLGMYSDGNGRFRRIFTYINFSCDNPHNYTFHIFREDFLAKLGKFFGQQDIEINVETFDDYFILRGNNPKYVTALLDAGMRTHFRDIHILMDGDYKLFEVDLSYTELCQIDCDIEVDRFKKIIEVGVALAQRINEVSPVKYELPE